MAHCLKVLEYDKIYKETIAEANYNSTIHVCNLKFQIVLQQRKSNFQTVVKSGNLIFNCDKKQK